MDHLFIQTNCNYFENTKTEEREKIEAQTILAS